MSHEAARFAAALERIGRDMLAALAGLTDEQLNRALPLPETNTLFALATHALGAAEYWGLTVIGGPQIPRDRASEFHATGTGGELVARCERWLAETHALLDTLPDQTMDRVVDDVITRHDWMGDEPFTVRDCLLHALEHCALHLGHIQLTRQLLAREDA